MKTVLTIFILCFSALSLQAQELKAYQIYNKEGKPVSFAQMVDHLSKEEVVLFGEYHNNSMIHWLQLKTTEALYQKKGDKLVLGAEMFERDNQDAVSAYVHQKIDAKTFKGSARFWDNYKTDYRPLVDFARDHELEFIATNIPRRYAQLVAKNGLDTLKGLSKEDRAYIAKLPIKVDMETPGYSEMKKFLAHHVKDNLMNFIKAQATKDATMAESILKHQRRQQLFLHFNGNYHSKSYGGIYWWLNKRKSWLEHLKVAVITSAKSDDPALPIPEKVVPTEFIIVVPSDMTKTY